MFTTNQASTMVSPRGKRETEVRGVVRRLDFRVLNDVHPRIMSSILPHILGYSNPTSLKTMKESVGIKDIELETPLVLGENTTAVGEHVPYGGENKRKSMNNSNSL